MTKTQPTFLKIANFHRFTELTELNPRPRTTQAACLLAAYHFNNRDNEVVGSTVFDVGYMTDCNVKMKVIEYDIENTQTGVVKGYRFAREDDSDVDVMIADVWSSRTIVFFIFR